MTLSQYMELQNDMELYGIKKILKIEEDTVQCVNTHDKVVCLPKEQVEQSLEEAIFGIEWNEWRESEEYRA